MTYHIEQESYESYDISYLRMVSLHIIMAYRICYISSLHNYQLMIDATSVC